MMDNKKELDPDFVEEISECIAEFDEYLSEKAESAPIFVSDNRANNLVKIVNEGTSAYGVINRILAESHSWPDREMFVLELLKPILNRTYKIEIEKNPRRMLYIISGYILDFRNTIIETVFLDLREYARDLVLLNGTIPADFAPASGFDLTIQKKPGGKNKSKSSLYRANFADILKEDYVVKEKDILEIFTSVKDDVPLLTATFYALKEADVINDLYSHFFDKLKHQTAVSCFLTKITQREKPVDKSSLAKYRDKDGYLDYKSNLKTQADKIKSVIAS